MAIESRRPGARQGSTTPSEPVGRDEIIFGLLLKRVRGRHELAKVFSEPSAASRAAFNALEDKNASLREQRNGFGILLYCLGRWRVGEGLGYWMAPEHEAALEALWKDRFDLLASLVTLLMELEQRYALPAARSFAEILEGLRRRQRLTQKELGERAGVRQGHVSDMERGVYQPTLPTLIALAKALDVDPCALIPRD